MKKLFFIIALFLSIPTLQWAQPDLPNMATLSQGGINVLSWNNPYTTGVRSVEIERSGEDGEFVKIGQIADLKKPSQFFTDPNPLPGNNYYRVKILFESNVEWLSNESLVHVDSTVLAERKTLPTQDSINSLVTQLGVKAPKEVVKPTFPTSQYVYTNPYNGNVIIELSNALEVSYKVLFYDDNDSEILEIPRVNDEMVVLDKRNFQKNGQYKFVVKKGEESFTEGYISIY